LTYSTGAVIKIIAEIEIKLHFEKKENLGLNELVF